MLNLHKIDKLRNPVYFRNSENNYWRCTKRGGRGHFFFKREINDPNNTILQILSLEPVRILNSKMKCKSDVDLRENIYNY